MLNDDIEKSLAELNRAAEINPRNTDVETLRSQIINAQGRADAELAAARVTELLLSAQKQIDGQRLFSPPGDNAEQSYRDVLALEHDSEPARKGLHTLAALLLKQLQQSLAQGGRYRHWK